MDGERFDRIVRHVAASGSRRGIIRFLAILAGWLSLPIADESQAGKGTGGRKGGKRHGYNRPRRRHARRRRDRHRRKKHKQKQKPPPPPREPCPQQSDSFCATNQLCVEEACQDCTVTCDGDATACGAALQAAIDAAVADGSGKVHVCPGRYAGNFLITARMNLIGAGDGDDPTRDTILDAGGEGRVVEIAFGGPGDDVSLTLLRLTGGGGPNHSGGGIRNGVGRTLTMTGCTVSGNSTASPGDGGGIHNAGTLTLNDCRIENNSAAALGGGILSVGSTRLTGDTQVRGNTAASQGGGIFAAVSDLRIDAGCQVTANTAPAGAGGGIYSFDGTVDLANDQIVTNNTGGNCASDGPPIVNCEG